MFLKTLYGESMYGCNRYWTRRIKIRCVLFFGLGVVVDILKFFSKTPPSEIDFENLRMINIGADSLGK